MLVGFVECNQVKHRLHSLRHVFCHTVPSVEPIATHFSQTPQVLRRFTKCAVCTVALGLLKRLPQIPALHFRSHLVVLQGPLKRLVPRVDLLRAGYHSVGRQNGIVFYEYVELLRNPDVPFETALSNLKTIAAELATYTPVRVSAGKAPQPVVVSWFNWLMSRA